MAQICRYLHLWGWVDPRVVVGGGSGNPWIIDIGQIHTAPPATVEMHNKYENTQFDKYENTQFDKYEDTQFDKNTQPQSEILWISENLKMLPFYG